MTAQAASRPRIPRMPSVFGTMTSPRQVSAGGPAFDQAASPRRKAAYAVFETEAAALERLLPDGFTLSGTPRLAIEFQALSEIDWLGGRGYNMLMLRVPVVFRHGGTVHEGWFQPVCWENMAEPILSGREELGWSKVYATLPVLQDGDERMQVAGEWEGFRFMDLALSGFSPAQTPPLGTAPCFHHKVVPATQAWGDCDASYVTMTPAGGSSMTVLSHRTATQADVRFHRPRWQDMPTQHQIVEPFASMPLGRLLTAGVFEARGGKDLSDQVRFESR